MNIGIYIYEKAEVLDFSGPFEVFSTASRMLKKSDKLNVFLVSETGGTITARGGYSVNPAYSFSNHPEIDLLIIVGGIYISEMKKRQVLNWIKKKSKKAKIIASVCTGVFLLAEAKILSSQRVTTHWEDIPFLRENYPSLNVLENQRWVEDGNVITSGGISAGIDMSLYLVSKIYTNEIAINTAKQMAYTPNKAYLK
ncbi:MAG: DJ-1/PfpI family protein [Methylococcales symbiont of Hymedesmia sp. n. MRB-2018]|nr:MAG: DJ-1/PfpI family protein [Methylococcales symbiont of Hymedesmia sp. n. MRB-2018]